MRCEHRQPALLLLDLRYIDRRTRQSNGHAVAETKGPVVPPAMRDRSHGKLRPLRELRAKQLLHQPRVDLDHRLCAYSITSLASTRSVGGIVRPSALAVFRLITSSNLVGCWTGR